MSKFLRLVENNLPSEEEAGMGNMVDKLVELLDSIDSITVTSDVPAQELTIDIDGHKIVLEVKDVHTKQHEEDAETMATPVAMDAQYKIDAKIADMASRAKSGALFGKIGSAAQLAKSAQNRRDNVVKKAIPIYDTVTKELEAALTKAQAKTNITVSQ